MPSLEFKGKSFVYTHHLSVPFRELVVDPKKSLPAKGQKPSLDDNLIIHGDNLHALKALLPVYAGKVDCIFIDPPYNTGEEGWCYNDNVRSPLMKEWLKKEANPVDKEDLERHDKWLCMMWPRLQLLKELMADDAMIFVAIDDNEMHRLRVLMDETFGEDNFLACISWIKRYTRSNNAKKFYSQRDAILCYRKTPLLSVVKEPRTEKADANYENPDKDKRGPWMTSSYVNPARKEDRQGLVYKIRRPKDGKLIEHPTHAWKYEPDEHARHVAEDRLWWGQDGLAEYPRLKLFLDEADRMVPVDVWSYREVGSSDDGSALLKEMFGAEVFENPKPVGLVEKAIGLTNKKNAVVLDSFAGSGTTAHAVAKLNSRDGGSRRFIVVQLDEDVPTYKPAFKMGYRRVVDVTRDRIVKALQGYEFKGTQREELHREPITWTKLKKATDLIEKVEGIEMMAGKRFDRIKATVDDGELVVTGEKDVKQKTDGLGGSFTFATLGPEMSIEALLTDGLPAFDALAKYVFYTATGLTLADVPKQTGKTFGYIGETESHRVHLLYQPDKAWLRSNDAALTEQVVDDIVATNKSGGAGKKTLVFAAAKFMGQRDLTKRGVDFCQLPYAIHRILGD